MRIGLTLPNRGVLFGAVTADELLDMAVIADQTPSFASVWVGDSLLGKPRLESVALLAGIAGRTSRVRIGPACMASIAIRDPVLLAYQWASLDLLAGGRTVMVACTGIVPNIGGRIEASLYGIQNKDRVGRMIEWIEILKRLWTEDDVSFSGAHYQFSGITIEPKPAAKPRPPIWIANNARGSRELIERTHQRVVDNADGWQTSIADPEDLSWRIGDLRTKWTGSGRDPRALETHLYHNINVQPDRGAALDEAKRFLDTYYETDFDPGHVEQWTAAGDPDACVAHLRRLRDLGFSEITLRVVSWDQMGHLDRVIHDVIPRVLDD